LVAPPLLRRATEAPPPAGWRDSARLLILPGSKSDEEWQEFLQGEVTRLESALAESQSHANETAGQLEDANESIRELLATSDDLLRKVRFLQGRLAESGVADAYLEPEGHSYEPILCSDAVHEARRRLSLLEIPESIDEAAAALDEHGNLTWAGKAWAAFQALQAYAEAKREGAGGNFKSFCLHSKTDAVIPGRWVALNESELTSQNQRFRELRTLPVDTHVDDSGRVYMESHIRLELGGSPSPRIHFYDDTGGSTGMVHIGWFGDHLDSFAKS
jgi:hypothetical protein